MGFLGAIEFYNALTCPENIFMTCSAAKKRIIVTLYFTKIALKNSLYPYTNGTPSQKRLLSL